MKKNTTYGAMALSLVLLLSAAPAMAMENADANIPADAPGLNVLNDVNNNPAPQAPAVEPEVHLNYAALARAKAAAFATATKDAVYNTGTKAFNGAKFVANPFEQEATVNYVDGLDQNSRKFRVAEWMFGKYQARRKTTLGVYYATLAAITAATTYGAYKAAPKVKAAAISVATKANNARKAAVAKVKQLWNSKKEVATAVATPASVAPRAKAARRAPVTGRKIYA